MTLGIRLVGRAVSDFGDVAFSYAEATALLIACTETFASRCPRSLQWSSMLSPTLKMPEKIFTLPAAYQ